MKYPITYAVRTTRAPGETEDTTVPVIIDRVQATDLARVVENCIDRGLVAGLKPTAAQGIAEGVAEQIAKEFTLGRSVAFGQYFYGRPYLSGTVDANGRVTSANGVNVRLYKGNAFKLTLDDFTFTFDGSGDSPRIDSVLSDGSGLRGEVVKGSSVKVNGRFLNAAGDANKVYFAEVGADDAEPVVVDAFTAAGDDILSFACPAALVAGRKYSVQREGRAYRPERRDSHVHSEDGHGQGGGDAARTDSADARRAGLRDARDAGPHRLERVAAGAAGGAAGGLRPARRFLAATTTENML